MQLDWLLAPVALKYEPAGHGEGSEVPTPQKKPGGHARQSLKFDAFGLVLKVPAGHAVAWGEPAGQ